MKQRRNVVQRKAETGAESSFGARPFPSRSAQVDKQPMNAAPPRSANPMTIEPRDTPSEVGEGVAAPSLLRRSPVENSLQRRVALAREKMTGNFVELTSIDYGVQLTGPPVELLKDSDLSTMTKDDSLAITAHGSPGKSGDYTGDEIAGYLTAKDTGLQESINEIIFTSCHAGKETKPDDTGSVVSTVKNKLEEVGLKGIRVRGARGPSIKSLGLGKSDFTVWDPNKRAAISSSADGLKGSLPANSILEALLSHLMEPQEKADKAVKELEPTGDDQKDLIAKAEAVRKATAPFYQALVTMIHDTGESVIQKELDAGTLVIDDAMAAAVGEKWGLKNLKGEELETAVRNALKHGNLLLEHKDGPIRDL